MIALLSCEIEGGVTRILFEATDEITDPTKKSLYSGRSVDPFQNVVLAKFVNVKFTASGQRSGRSFVCR